MTMMGVKDAARLLNTSPGAIYKAIDRGKIQAVLVPGGSRGFEYAIGDAEVERYRRAHLRPGHRKVKP